MIGSILVGELVKNGSSIGSGLGKIFKSGGPRMNTNHNNKFSADPLVWHNGEAFDGSLSKEQNTPLYIAQREIVKRDNLALYNEFEQFKSMNKRDPKLSEWKSFKANSIVNKASKIIAEGGTKLKKMKPGEVVSDSMSSVKDWATKNPWKAVVAGAVVVTVVLPMVGGVSVFSYVKKLLKIKPKNNVVKFKKKKSWL